MARSGRVNRRLSAFRCSSLDAESKHCPSDRLAVVARPVAHDDDAELSVRVDAQLFPSP
jgi:hypothetical protein